jgi:hypothetical protein
MKRIVYLVMKPLLLLLIPLVLLTPHNAFAWGSFGGVIIYLPPEYTELGCEHPFQFNSLCGKSSTIK